MNIEDRQEAGNRIVGVLGEYFDHPASREESLVKTKLEEALLWLTRVELD